MSERRKTSARHVEVESPRDGGSLDERPAAHRVPLDPRRVWRATYPAREVVGLPAR